MQGEGVVEVRPVSGENHLLATIRTGDVRVLAAVVARLRRLFDLDADIATIDAHLARDGRLSRAIRERPGVRVPGAWDGFEIAVRAVLGQQITVRAATRLAGELVNLLAEPVPPGLLAAGLDHAFPPPARFRAELLAKLPMPRARAATLAAVAQASLADPALFDATSDLDQAVARLIKLPGIGVWSAHYIAMRALSQSDAFPAADIGLQRALAEHGVRPSEKTLLARAESWRPWRSYAVLHLWTADAARQREESALKVSRQAEQTARRPVRQQTVRGRPALRAKMKENVDALAS
jgi:3-methyladenine DNA glycosylase/8-oxoguanine DNA glycosylase